MKKLTIITICYNEPNLEKTCESIINQTWQDFEWVVIDGGSNAETQAVWNKYKYRIDKFVSEKDNGLYNAMNKGILLATGEYLNFMNAGDSFYDKYVLENIFKDKSYTADVLYGNYVYFSKKKKKNTIGKAPKKLSDIFWIITTLNHQSTFIKKNLFQKYGLYDEQYKIAADYDGFLRFYKKNAIFQYIDRIIAFFDTNGLSSSSSKSRNHDFDTIKGKYFSKEEIQQCIQEYDRKKHSFLERIFSLKKSHDRKFKILTILNFCIKIPCKKEKQ